MRYAGSIFSELTYLEIFPEGEVTLLTLMVYLEEVLVS